MPSHPLGSGKEVSESAFEALLIELGAHYAQPGAVQPPKAALESIGYQVGLQLVERCVARAVALRSAVRVTLCMLPQVLTRQAALRGAPGGHQVSL